MEDHGDPSPDEPETNVPAPRPQPLGGVFHTYLGYDAVKFGSAQPSDPGAAAKGAFEHLMAAGNMRRFTDEELADAIRSNTRRYILLASDVIWEMLPEYREREPVAKDALDVYIHHRQMMESRMRGPNDNRSVSIPDYWNC